MDKIDKPLDKLLDFKIMSSESKCTQAEMVSQHERCDLNNNDPSRRNHQNRKRGMKPRSQRDRKKPKSKHDLPLQIFESTITQLQLDIKMFDIWVRTVTPYAFTFKSHAKQRWLGRSILDIYQHEFGAYPDSYYLSAIQQGRILVSDHKVDINYQIKGGDVLSHTVHRHEPGVAVNTFEGIDVIAETDDLVVVNKPGTLPVHPCGGYNQNSLISILEPKFGKLYNVNRLDRLTSGVVMLAKSSNIAQKMGVMIQQRESCEKIYLARVKGKFPMNCNKDYFLHAKEGKLPENGDWSTNTFTTHKKRNDTVAVIDMKKRNALGYWFMDSNGSVQEDITLEQVFASPTSIENWIGSLDSSTLAPSDIKPNLVWLHLACPVRIAGHKDGICEGGAFTELSEEQYHKSVKAAQTAFGVVRYDAETDSTILVCRPMTGRTHQIRLHLRFLGHSIANDPNYGGDIWFGDSDGEIACQEAQKVLNTLNISTTQASPIDIPATEEEIEALGKIKQEDGEPFADFIERTCVWCARHRGGGVRRTMLEFLIRSRGIWLHAIQYTLVDASGTKVLFRTKSPGWC